MLFPESVESACESVIYLLNKCVVELIALRVLLNEEFLNVVFEW